MTQKLLPLNPREPVKNSLTVNLILNKKKFKFIPTLRSGSKTLSIPTTNPCTTNIFLIQLFKTIRWLEFRGCRRWLFVIGERIIKIAIKNPKENHWSTTSDFRAKQNGSMQPEVEYPLEPIHGEALIY